jgi:flagellar biogenesis protein FliO
VSSLFGFLAVAAAETGIAAQQTATAAAERSSFSYTQILGFFAIAAIYAFLFYLWYSLKNQRGLGAWLKKTVKERDVKVLEVTNLGFRTSIYLIDVRGKRFLVLTSPQGVQLRAVDGSEAQEGASDASFEKILESKK